MVGVELGVMLGVRVSVGVKVVVGSGSSRTEESEQPVDASRKTAAMQIITRIDVLFALPLLEGVCLMISLSSHAGVGRFFVVQNPLR